MKKTFISVLFFSVSVLYGQLPAGYVLIKTNVSSPASNAGTGSFQWVASNNTSKDGNFFILEEVPNHHEIQSVVRETLFTSVPPSKPSLPLNGPAPLTIGPFPIPANTSVTFHVNEIFHGDPTAGETFTLLSESQLSGKSRSLASSSLVEGQGTPTPTATPVPDGSLIQSAVAAPNISRGNQPINFVLNLTKPSKVDLSLFTITGEQVFDTQTLESAGKTTLVWDTQNKAHQSVASGLYIYLLKVVGAGIEETRSGKILILH